MRAPAVLKTSIRFDAGGLHCLRGLLHLFAEEGRGLRGVTRVRHVAVALHDVGYRGLQQCRVDGAVERYVLIIEYYLINLKQ